MISRALCRHWGLNPESLTLHFLPPYYHVAKMDQINVNLHSYYRVFYLLTIDFNVLRILGLTKKEGFSRSLATLLIPTRAYIITQGQLI